MPAQPMDKEKIHDLSRKHPILFFDGVCGLCNSVVDWVTAKDPAGHFRFTPLQGATAAQILSDSEREELKTIVILKNGRIFKQSDAVIEILLDLKQPWRGLGWILKLIPRTLRDFGYSCVATSRYRFFGKRETCRLPTAEERARFLN